MSLRSIPYYPSLKDLALPGGVQPIDIILFGAIIFHSTGKLDKCVAKVETLAEETGYSISEIKNRRSRLITAGWITKETNKYGEIISVSPAMNYDSTSGTWTPFSQMTEPLSVKRLNPFQSNDGTLTPDATSVGKTSLKTCLDDSAQAQSSKSPLDSVLESTNEVSGETMDGGGAGEHMKPEVLLTKIRAGFGVRQNVGRKARVEAVAMLQEEYSDDDILEAVGGLKNMADSKFPDGSKWKVNYVWFTDKEKHELVCNWIDRATTGGVKMRWEDVGE